MNNKHKISKWIGNILLFTGAAWILLLMVNLYANQFEQKKYMDAFSAMKADAASAMIKPEAADDSMIPPENQNARKSDQLEGILEIPQIELKAPVQLGADERTLAAGLGAIENMDAPGETGGSYAIAGHQSYTFGHYFNRLHEMKEGQIFTFETVDEKQVYEVFDIQIVKPEQVEVLDRQNEIALMSLITCYPERSNTFRLVVQAKRIQ
ncbi:class D sortase [Sporosarcina sp. PTS2304]|uniref:class D sortase n=1 Tax=Sporosarcina sp. PTS2304 TaxID=2283194 RepID=UPI000E0DBCC8|nr:class D sortase [Sporosarcina sp. PTS2304]AXH99811.1 class D sortase [Sporosarcina sp. PTS2304]